MSILSDTTMRLLLEMACPAEQKVALLKALDADWRAYYTAPNTLSGTPQVFAAPPKVWVCVIAVDHPDDKLIKVGISNNPEFRKVSLERERGYNLYVVHTEGPYSRSEAYAIEQQAHRMLAEYRERGEWFACGIERAVGVVRTCATEAAS